MVAGLERGPRGLVEEVKIPNWWQRMGERLKRPRKRLDCSFWQKARG